MTGRWGRARWAGRMLGAALLPLWIASGCGNLTSGGVGEVEVLVVADSVSLTSGLLGQATAADPIVGELTVRMRVYLLRGPGDWVELTEGVQQVTLPLDGTEAHPIARGSLPAGRYTRVRTLFRLVHAEVEGGLRIDGESYVGPVSVTLPPEGFSVERALPFEVVQGGESAVLVELHAGRWLRRLNRQEQQVARDDFEEVQEVRSR